MVIFKTANFINNKRIDKLNYFNIHIRDSSLHE